MKSEEWAPQPTTINNFNLSGKVVLITGGSRGIGKGIAIGMAKAGADVAIVSRTMNQSEEVAKEVISHGCRGLAFAADVTNVSEAERVVMETVNNLGKINVLVNNAGVHCFQEAWQMTEAEWDNVMTVNLKAMFFWSSAAAKVMAKQGGGKIVNISSISGVVGESKVAAYGASKAGVISLTKSLAREWARYNINVNSIGPGYIATDMNKQALSDEQVYKSVIGKIPMRRIGTTDDLVGPAVFLASRASDFITGHTLFVDGGRVTG